MPCSPVADRRRWLQAGAGGWLAATGLAPQAALAASGPADPHSTPTGQAQQADALPDTRSRPGQPGWPDDAQWAALRAQVGDALQTVPSPWAACADPTHGAQASEALAADLRNPYAISDHPGLTQTLGWVDAWTSQPPAQAVVARHPQDVVAAVDFARRHRLRLVVRGGAHSYLGGSNAADALLLWTRRMADIQLIPAFVPQGGAGRISPQRAVSVGAGALWGAVYDAVVTQAGAYVQGGGCLSVGVAGLVQSGGFGSFSKAYGLAAASLLQAELVTADGVLRTVNALQDPELFWALKGGGGGSFGVVTRLTLQLHDLPANDRFGAVNFSVRATSDEAFARLLARVVDHLAVHLVNPHWGEQIRLRGRRLQVAMVFQGLTRAEAQAAWQPLFDWLDQRPGDYQQDAPLLRVVSTSARSFFAPTWLKRSLGFIRQDPRPGAPAHQVFWPGDQAQAGQVLQAYGSRWLPAALLQPARRAGLVQALQAASTHWGVSLHLNKGLAGASPEVLAAAGNTAVNPVALDAFALAISAAEQPAAHPDWPGHAPDAGQARSRRQAVERAMAELARIAPDGGAYQPESDYFQPDWARAHWGVHADRLAAVKARVDPQDLFIVHHGVGSGRWSADGFRRLG